MIPIHCESLLERGLTALEGKPFCSDLSKTICWVSTTNLSSEVGCLLCIQNEGDCWGLQQSVVNILEDLIGLLNDSQTNKSRDQCFAIFKLFCLRLWPQAFLDFLLKTAALVYKPMHKARVYQTVNNTSITHQILSLDKLVTYKWQSIDPELCIRGWLSWRRLPTRTVLV